MEMRPWKKARRETKEAKAELLDVRFLNDHIPHISQVYVFFTGELRDENFGPVAKAEVCLFSEHEIP